MEFLIKGENEEWLNLPSHQFEEILRPSSFPSKRIAGWGDHRIEVDGCEVAFSYEDAGILVSFEGTGLPEEQAAQVVAEIGVRASAATGQGIVVIPL